MAEPAKPFSFRVDKPPIFADEVFISNRIKVSKTKRTSGVLRLQFTDMLTKVVIADIIIDSVTCEGLIRVLQNKLKEIDKIMKSPDPVKEIKKLSRQPPVKATNKEEIGYTG
jgi:hypothetical protein